MGVTRRDIQAGAEQLGVSGRPICVHGSLRSFGRVEGGAATVVQGMLEMGCTVLVPTFSYFFGVAPPKGPTMRPERNGVDYSSVSRRLPGAGRIFTPASVEVSREAMGAIPVQVLGMPGHVRGNHPLNSFTAVGSLAHELMEGQKPTDVYRPLEVLADVGGWVLLMGVGLTSMTLLHLAEKMAGRELFRRWALDPQGKVQMVETGSCSNGFEAFAPVLAHLERRVVVGESTWRAYPAKPALESAAKAILDDALITRCDHDACERCRDAVLGGPVLTRERAR